METLPPLIALRAFEAVATRLSVKAAAEALSITPSALSHQLRILEESLGLKLFHRLNRRLLLTDAGQVYFSKIAPAFETLRAATAEIAERGQAETLVVTAVGNATTSNGGTVSVAANTEARVLGAMVIMPRAGSRRRRHSRCRPA